MQDVAATFVVTGLVLLTLSEILVYVWVVAEQVVQQPVYLAPDLIWDPRVLAAA
jgi:hypothetical protein